MIIKMGKSNKPGFGYRDTGEGLINDSSETVPFSETREYYTVSHALYICHSLRTQQMQNKPFHARKLRLREDGQPAL